MKKKLITWTTLLVLPWLNSWVQCKGDLNRQALVCTFVIYTQVLTFKVLTAQGFCLLSLQWMHCKCNHRHTMFMLCSNISNRYVTLSRGMLSAVTCSQGVMFMFIFSLLACKVSMVQLLRPLNSEVHALDISGNASMYMFVHLPQAQHSGIYGLRYHICTYGLQYHLVNPTM